MSHNGTNGRNVPGPISRSSSVTLVSPVIKDGVEDIAHKLSEIDDIIGGIDDESEAGTDNVSDARKELFEEISKLGEDINKIKLEQISQISAIRNDIKENTSKQILQSSGARLQSFITNAITVEVKKEMGEFGNKAGTKKFVGALREMVDQNEVLLEEARIGLENSRSRHVNSTFDIHDDFNTELRAIKLRDGNMSKAFPKNLRELFSYDAEQLLLLIKDYGLHPLDKHSENLNRFLMFIGVNASIPDQLIGLSDELPPYGGATGVEDEKNQRGGRRHSSASQNAKQNDQSNKGWTPWF